MKDHHQLRLKNLYKTRQLLDSSDDDVNISLEDSLFLDDYAVAVGESELYDHDDDLSSDNDFDIAGNTAVNRKSADINKSLGVTKVNASIQEVLRRDARRGTTFNQGHNLQRYKRRVKNSKKGRGLNSSSSSSSSSSDSIIGGRTSNRHMFLENSEQPESAPEKGRTPSDSHQRQQEGDEDEEVEKVREGKRREEKGRKW